MISMIELNKQTEGIYCNCRSQPFGSRPDNNGEVQVRKLVQKLRAILF